MFLGYHYAPSRGRRGPSVPEIFGTPYLRRNGLTYSDEMWYGKTWQCLGVSRVPFPKGDMAQRPQNFWDP